MGYGWEFDVLFALLAANAAVVVLCHVLAPREWARILCRSTLFLNGLVLLFSLLFGLTCLPWFSVMFLPWVLIALEVLLLAHIYTTRCRKR